MRPVSVPLAALVTATACPGGAAPPETPLKLKAVGASWMAGTDDDGGLGDEASLPEQPTTAALSAISTSKRTLRDAAEVQWRMVQVDQLNVSRERSSR
jgi:hypothetical protein